MERSGVSADGLLVLAFVAGVGFMLGALAVKYAGGILKGLAVIVVGLAVVLAAVAAVFWPLDGLMQTHPSAVLAIVAFAIFGGWLLARADRRPRGPSGPPATNI